LKRADERGTHVKNLNVGTAIDGSANVDTLLLTTRQGDATFADLSEVTVGEELQVGIQTRVVNGLPIPIRLERLTEANVLADGGILRSI
jgi:hypothetical protein